MISTMSKRLWCKKTAFTLSLASIFLLSTLIVNPLVAQQSSDSKSTNVAIKVDKETISKQQFDKALQQRVQRMQQRMKRRKSRVKPNRSMLRKRVKQQLKKDMVQQLVLRSHAKKSDVSVSDSAVERQWKRLVKKVGGKKVAKKKLKRSGMTKQEIMERIRSRERMKQFVDKNTPSTEVTDKEVRDYYENNKQRFGKTSYEKAKRFLKRRLQQQKRRKHRQKLVQKLRKKSTIQVNV